MKRVLLIILPFFSIVNLCPAQQVINGISCVTPGVEYEYRFDTGQDSTVAIQACVTGGSISGSSENCVTAGGMTVIKISWNQSSDNGTIDITYPTGHLTKSIDVTPALMPGVVDTASKSQTVAAGALPADIVCSAAAGGGCSPDYSYQWEQSASTLDWTDIPTAQGQNLTFSGPITQLFYFRRKVTEKNSKSVAYTDFAAVFVNR